MAFVDWSLLPADLVNCVAECFLATSDLDYYMDFRAVCRSWRSATGDPKNSPHPRFRPRRWVILDKPFDRSNTHIFVNTTTGRYLRKELPLLRDYNIESVTPDGLLILSAIRSSHISVLNSFTGYFIRFIAPFPDDEIIESAALVSGSLPSIVLLCKMYSDRFIVDEDDDDDDDESSPKIYIADLDSESFNMYEDTKACPLIRLAVRGVYTNGELGSVPPFPVAVAEKIFHMVRFSYVDAAGASDDEDTKMSAEEAMVNLWIGYDNRFPLLGSAREMLIIIKRSENMEVYKMDTNNYLLEHVLNIGDRAIFLCGSSRCISVNADKFTSVDANCIYYMKSLEYYFGDYIYMYNLKYHTEERVSKLFCCSPYSALLQPPVA